MWLLGEILAMLTSVVALSLALAGMRAPATPGQQPVVMRRGARLAFPVMQADEAVEEAGAARRGGVGERQPEGDARVGGLAAERHLLAEGAPRQPLLLPPRRHPLEVLLRDVVVLVHALELARI